MRGSGRGDAGRAGRVPSFRLLLLSSVASGIAQALGPTAAPEGGPVAGGTITGGGDAARRRSRRELWLVLLLGLAGAGLVLLALRQDWGTVTSAAPRPLPSGSVAVTGEQLVPAADALAVAAIASLAAVLATRRLARRITGILLAGLGAGIAVTVSAGLSAADVIAAAAGSAGQSVSTGAGSGPGSVTAGASQSGSGTPLAGFAGHATLSALGWRDAAVAGALAIIAAGIGAAWRAWRLPVMSSRYERTPDPAAPGEPARPEPGRPVPSVEMAGLWESLSRGEDPTGPPGTAP
jgi:uncharacterized membrane protein (TIGR02234 family)